MNNDVLAVASENIKTYNGHAHNINPIDTNGYCVHQPLPHLHSTFFSETSEDLLI